ncbi:uncharacterized protein BP01DRAFT_415818 [Aspergillus saccharolyticus JOP 1030-1]|uniref:Uncharacterized protein n=1 Tax=Aspergillus saccharolyticus JOP 1030-1 TaxID=1450539 RepID=A0A319AFN9_9EURO|nr:hypothetical protein BP01DRAFT_415818 [Aspergillus saccharolyticus JOP 1030-1]PYH45592.1 hypothetical protein BP01DRAFT_415818 [Aspergillus saccharolyticus JOP 1030-1]
MWYLGVPIAVAAPMIVVQDNDYTAAIKRLESAGFKQSVPNRVPPPEFMEIHPNPQQVLEEINAGYERLDRSCAVFDYPNGEPTEKGLQVYLFPNMFAHSFQDDFPRPLTEAKDGAPRKRFEIYGNLCYPLEQTLLESFVKAAIDEETEKGFSAWGELLRSWVSMMTGYLEVDNDALDHCPDQTAVEWYSHNFGRIHEANCGPIDRRVTKRLGSGKEMPVDMRGNPV